jgi:hypothetical protein
VGLLGWRINQGGEIFDMLDKLLEEIERLRDAKGLLETILLECSGYGYEIPGMSAKTRDQAQKFMNFDDSE